MKIRGFIKGLGDYLIVRYVVYWKSGKYFHKRVCFERGKYEEVNEDAKDNFYFVAGDDSLCWQLRSLGHNLEVIGQYSSLEELDKYYQFCKNYNEY